MRSQLNPRNLIATLCVTMMLTSLGLAADLKPVRVEGVLIEKQDHMFRLLDSQGNESLVRVTCPRLVADSDDRSEGRLVAAAKRVYPNACRPI